MSRYDTGNDPYVYEGTNVLINIKGLKEQCSLDLFEKIKVDERINTLGFMYPPYSLNTWSKIHKHLFCDVYSWAGKLRTIGITKGYTKFWQPEAIQKEAEKIFNNLDCLISSDCSDKNIFCEKISEAYCELNMVHPFREGNGRTQRILFEYVGLMCGYQFDWSKVPINDWLNANLHGVRCDYEPMKNIFSILATKYTVEF